MNVKPYEVEFSGTVEELLQTPIFYDELRSEQLYEQPEALQPQELGARRALGSAAIRLIATARTEQRMLARRLNPNLDVREWNKHQPLTKSTWQTLRFIIRAPCSTWPGKWRLSIRPRRCSPVTNCTI